MKRLSSFFMACCILLSLLILPAVNAAPDTTVYVRKHVSILYDNSGSMKDNIPNLKWCYASYAAQMFTGLLNDTDSLSITFMDHSSLSNIDLRGLRQDAVSKVLEYTSSANADTPIERIGTALSVLEGEGLMPGLGANDAGEQYWLVLTTDGVFRQNGENLSPERVVNEIDAVLEKYPDLHAVYFGIGTKNSSAENKAVDFRKGSDVDAALLNKLHAHANFTAVYAEDQEQIVSTMQELSNQISGRYSVSNEFKVNGKEVCLYLSGEGSPIRNIALMAQESNAKLVSATAEDGTKLTVGREAQIRFPYNKAYDNLPEGTLGGYTALITGANGEKIPSGNITLVFSEPVNAEKLSLMYEPAIHVRFNIERKTENGEWVALPDSDDPVDGDEIRISYAICEDGTNKELDAAKLFGKTEATLRYNGKTLDKNESVTVTAGDALLDVDVSMMDGGYRINASRTIHVRIPGKEDLTVEISDPLSLYRKEAAQNTEKAVQFTVLLRDEPISAEFARDLSLQVQGDAGTLKGKTDQPQTNIFRFTPQDETCAPGTYKVQLLCKNEPIAEVAVEILPNETTFTAEAGPSISIMSNRVSDNTDAVTFTVTAHRDDGDGPINAEEAALLTVSAERDGVSYNGTAELQSGGVLAFVLRDANAAAGDYDVTLRKGDETLATTHITVIHYDANYTVETVISDPDTADRFDLLHNPANVSFIIYEDGIPCGAAQLEAMLDRELIVTHDLESHYAKMDVQIGTANGKPAVVCTPTSSSRSGFVNFFRRFPISLGVTGLNRESITVGLTVEMPHGDSGEGVLKLTGYRVIYLAILIVLAALLVLAGMFIFANLKAARLKKGIIWQFTLRNDGSIGTVRANKIGNAQQIGWGWKPMLGVPVNESITVGTVKFEAKPPQGRRKGFIRVQPTVTIKEKNPAELQLYYRSDVSDVAAKLLREIKRDRPVTLKDGDQPISASEFFSVENKIADETDEQTASCHIAKGNAMIYKIGATGDYTVWVYEAAKRETAPAKGHRAPARRRSRSRRH